ncbi:hypothetical protein IA203_03615 [Corynebacterium wankanglinii]|nr:hypothetical protein IA203_03615 [Corynebacterium wankanglinii]
MAWNMRMKARSRSDSAWSFSEKPLWLLSTVIERQFRESPNHLEESNCCDRLRRRCLFSSGLQLVSEGGSEDPLVIYSNSVSDGRGEWLAEKAAEAGYEIEFVNLGGGDIQDRLVAEKANRWLTWSRLNNVFFEHLKADGS